jgi:hypothetical protein
LETFVGPIVAVDVALVVALGVTSALGVGVCDVCAQLTKIILATSNTQLAPINILDDFLVVLP